MNELNGTAEALTTEPGRPQIAGDYQDDDREVFDTLIMPEAEPPTPDELPKDKVEPLHMPKPLTRLLTGANTVLASWDPTMLVPADSERVGLQIWASSDTATDYVRFSDDPGKVQSRQSSALLYSGQLLELPKAHTGPVWISAADATGPVTVTFVAVTR